MRPVSLTNLIGSLILVQNAKFIAQNKAVIVYLVIQYAKVPIFLKRRALEGNFFQKRFVSRSKILTRGTLSSPIEGIVSPPHAKFWAYN